MYQDERVPCKNFDSLATSSIQKPILYCHSQVDARRALLAADNRI